MRKTTMLRQLFSSPGCIKVIGVSDGITAKMGDQAGFDALWASGLAISASHCVPDASILTMSEFLSAASLIHKATKLPVIADCDTGFGEVNNVVRMVREYERSGIAAVCIEDKEFPKRNSFLENHRLANKHEFCGKIMAAKDAQLDPDFMIIARLESLIANAGMNDALDRAFAYSEAGADAILVHSKSTEPTEIKEFASIWKMKGGAKPLIVVPTTYYNIKCDELYNDGFKMVIYANQALRASVMATKEAFEEILRTGSTASIEGKISSVKEIFSLIGTDELNRIESWFHEVIKPQLDNKVLASNHTAIK